MLQINEAGLFNHWNHKTRQGLKGKPNLLSENENQEIDENYSLKYSDLKMVFLGIIFELLACCLVFIGELIVYKCSRHAKMRNCNDKTLRLDYVN